MSLVKSLLLCCRLYCSIDVIRQSQSCIRLIGVFSDRVKLRLPYSTPITTIMIQYSFKKVETMILLAVLGLKLHISDSIHHQGCGSYSVAQASRGMQECS